MNQQNNDITNGTMKITGTMKMNEIIKASIQRLDFDQIKEALKECAVSDEVKQTIDQLPIYTDYFLIQRHLEETTEARKILDDASSVPIHSLQGIKTIIDKLPRHEVLRVAEIETMGNFIKDANRIKKFMLDKVHVSEKVANYALSIVSLETLYSEIVRSVTYGRVDDNASTALSKIRKKIEIAEDRIKTKINDYLVNSKYANVLADHVVSQRNGRYVIPVKSEHKKTIDGMVLDRSRSGGTFFVEPVAIKKLSDELSQLRIDEENEVYRIISELTNSIADNYPSLHLNFEIMSHYDFIFAKAKLSRRYEAVPCVVNTNKIIHIIEGRHPLLGRDAVPMSVKLTQKQRNLVITGPNTGGKTVTMKTIALLCLMTQAGLHIPCERGTTLPILDKILCDIGDGQSLQQNLSTFSSHITNIIQILEESTENSLSIFDEIGSGTDPSEGTGIGIAVLEAMNAKLGFTLTSTHYNEIKRFATEHPDFINGSMGFDLKTLKPLYQLEVGTSGNSNAINIASRIGLPETLVKRAYEVANKGQMQPNLMVEGADSDGMQLADSVQLADGMQLADEVQLADNLQLADSLQLVNEASESIKQTTQELVSMSSELSKSKYAPAPKSQYKVGDVVYVKTMKRQGTVCETENKKGEMTLLIMGNRVKVNVKRVAPYIDSKDLYPEDYDLSIVMETKTDRKVQKAVNKGKRGVILEKRGNQ